MNSQVEKKIEDTSRMERRPKVSVCVVTYNQEKYIGQCLQSLVDQKTNFDFEIIVGDDCSTDGTREIVRGFQERYPKIIRTILHETNIGACKNYISVHTTARGEYIAHLDGDDYALPGKLQAIADTFDQFPDVNIVFHRMRYRNELFDKEADDLLTTERLKSNIFTRSDFLRIGTIGIHSSKAYRSTVALKEFPTHDFLDYYLDVEQIGDGKAILLRDVLGVYRIASGISHHNKMHTKRCYAEALQYFLNNYPKFKAEIGCNALTCALADIKNGRPTWFFFLNIFFHAKSMKSIYLFIKTLPCRKIFRTDVLGRI
jgi:glycosyltransferase involved in cell wall biosynthesis